jgi:hypothetical protein
MIRLKNILVEEEPKDQSKDPNKMLVKSKKTGQSYYINKDNFDASVHEKPTLKLSKKTKEEPSEKPEDKKEKPKEEPTKLSPMEKMENEIGSLVILDDKEKEEIADDGRNLRPDLKEKLLKFEFTPYFREFDSLLDQVQSYNDKKDNESAKKAMTGVKKVAKKIQSVAIAKLAALNVSSNDPKVISAAKYYHNGSFITNEFLRSGGKVKSSLDDLEKILDKNNEKEMFMSDPTSLWSMNLQDYSILLLDQHFKSDGAKLESDTIVYRGMERKILDAFVDAGEWIDNGFVSTSLNPLVAEEFTSKQLIVSGLKRKDLTPIFKIKLKKGDPVLTLPCSEDEFCIESEVTLPRGCKFVITGKDEERNIYEVSVEFPND